MLAEQGGVYAVATFLCCIYINTSADVETHLDKIRQEATWLQQVSDKEAEFDLLSDFFGWLPLWYWSLPLIWVTNFSGYPFSNIYYRDDV